MIAEKEKVEVKWWKLKGELIWLQMLLRSN
jgi:hypothetical protein